MRLDGLNFEERDGKVTISDREQNYDLLVYPDDNPPVCKRTEDFFSLRRGKGFQIDWKCVRYDGRLRMIVEGQRDRIAKLIKFRATVFSLKNRHPLHGVIIDHPFFNGFFCLPESNGEKANVSWVFYRPFRLHNCDKPGSFFSVSTVDGPAFHAKYIKTPYSFSEKRVSLYEFHDLHGSLAAS